MFLGTSSPELGHGSIKSARQQLSNDRLRADLFDRVYSSNLPLLEAVVDIEFDHTDQEDLVRASKLAALMVFSALSQSGHEQWQLIGAEPTEIPTVDPSILEVIKQDLTDPSTAQNELSAFYQNNQSLQRQIRTVILKDLHGLKNQEVAQDQIVLNAGLLVYSAFEKNYQEHQLAALLDVDPNPDFESGFTSSGADSSVQQFSAAIGGVESAT